MTVEEFDKKLNEKELTQEYACERCHRPMAYREECYCEPQPCPECEKHKAAVDRLIYSIWAEGCSACAVISGCAAKDHAACQSRLSKWAYGEEVGDE
jgi:hypothetical protein